MNKYEKKVRNDILISFYKRGLSLYKISNILANLYNDSVYYYFNDPIYMENINILRSIGTTHLKESSIYLILKDNGIPLRNKGGKEDYTKEEIDKMKFLYFEELMTLKEVSDVFKCVPNTIKKYISSDERYSERVKFNYNNPNLNHNFFENIDAEEKAYILGFLIADGNVYKDKSSYRIRIEVQLEDRYIVDLIKEKIGISNSVIYRKKQSKNKLSHTIKIAFVSEKIFKDLEKYGVVPNKTDKTFFPNVPKNMYCHLIRGLLDGDGSIPDYRESYRQSIQFIGSKQLITSLKDFLIKELNVYDVVVSERKKKIPIYQVVWSSRVDVKNIGEFLYSNSHYYLKRKYLVWKSYNI